MDDISTSTTLEDTPKIDMDAVRKVALSYMNENKIVSRLEVGNGVLKALKNLESGFYMTEPVMSGLVQFSGFPVQLNTDLADNEWVAYDQNDQPIERQTNDD